VSPPEEPTAGHYRPTLSQEHIDQIRLWHDRAYVEELDAGSVERTFDYLGVTIVVPPQVMPITPMSHLLGEAVLREARAGERILDMGTGSGVNAILAAKRGAEVLAVDVSPAAVDAARANVERNGLGDMVDVRHSDVFSDVDGSFDLIVFDPPFRWFKPRSVTESVMADEGYQALARFFGEARSHLTPDGWMLIFFGTSGDLAHLQRLMDEEGFRYESIAHDDLIRDGWTVDYFTFKVTPLRRR
jgi:release factor glutamine methyltransferase